MANDQVPEDQLRNVVTAPAAPIADAPATAPAEPPRVGGRFIFVYMLTYFGLNVTMLMPTLFSMAYKMQLIDPEGKDTSLGLVLGIGGLFGLFAGPVAGVLSDATRLRWGRRRPWLAGGIALQVVGGLVIAFAPNVVLVIIGFAITQLAMAAISAGFNPVLAEHVPSEQRGRIGALGGAAASLAGISCYLLGGQLTGNLLGMFLIPVAILAVGAVFFFFTVKDAPAPTGAVVPSFLTILKGFYFNPLKFPDFGFVWLGKFLLQFGFTFFSTYQLYLLTSRMGYTAEEAAAKMALVGGLAVAATLIATLGGGFLSDKFKRRKIFIIIATVLISSGLVIVAFTDNFVIYVIGGVLLSAGQGAFNSVDLAMATDLLPEKDQAGKYMSIYYLSSSVPGTLAPFVASGILLLSGSSYAVLFLTGAVLSLGALLTTAKIKGVR